MAHVAGGAGNGECVGPRWRSGIVEATSSAASSAATETTRKRYDSEENRRVHKPELTRRHFSEAHMQ